MQCSALYPFSKEKRRQFLDEVLDLSASKWRWIGPMLCQFDNLGGVDIVTTNDQESPLVGDISLRPCLIRQSGELQCIASPPSISQKKKRKENVALLVLLLLLLNCKKEGKAISFIDWYYIMEWAQTALRWVKMAKRNESYNGKRKKFFVRSGIRTHALIRGPERSIVSEEYSSWVWRLRPLGHPDLL